MWGNVWRIVGVEYVRRIMVGIFHGKSRLAEVSPDKMIYGDQSKLIKNLAPKSCYDMYLEHVFQKLGKLNRI